MLRPSPSNALAIQLVYATLHGEQRLAHAILRKIDRRTATAMVPPANGPRFADWRAPFAARSLTAD